MKASLMTLIAVGFACNLTLVSVAAANSPIKYEGIRDVSLNAGSKSEQLDRKMLQQAMEQSFRSLSEEDILWQRAFARQHANSESPATAGGKP